MRARWKRRKTSKSTGWKACCGTSDARLPRLDRFMCFRLLFEFLDFVIITAPIFKLICMHQPFVASVARALIKLMDGLLIKNFNIIMGMVTGVVLLLLALAQLSEQQAIRDKAIQFVSDIQPDYSITEQIYADIETALKAQNSPTNSQAAPNPEKERNKAAAIQAAERQQQIRQQQRQSEELMKTKTISQPKQVESTPQSKIGFEFQKHEPVHLGQDNSYVVNKIEEARVIDPAGNIKQPQLTPILDAVSTTQHSSQVEARGPANKTPQLTTNWKNEKTIKNQTPNAPISNQNTIRGPQNTRTNPFATAQSKLQPFLTAMERVSNQIKSQELPKIFNTFKNNKETAPEKVNLRTQLEKAQKSNGEDIQQFENKRTVEMLASEGEEFTRSMFSLFLFLSVVLIVFGYTPEDQESAKGIAYNPSADDEEIELR